MSVGNKDDGSKGIESVVKITVDGKEETFDAKRIETMLSEQASITQKAQAASAVLNACERLGVEPEQFLARSEGAFQVLNELLDKKIISDEGEILVNPSKDVPADDKGGKDLKFDAKPDPKDPEARTLEVIQKALKPIAEKLGGFENELTKVNRVLIQNKLMELHPSLTGDDVSRVLGAAKANPSKSVLEHAEAFVKAKANYQAEMRAKHAAEFGIDLKTFDENKLKEQDAEGGAGAMFKEKKFSFDKKKDDPNVVTPREATEAFFNKNM